LRVRSDKVIPQSSMLLSIYNEQQISASDLGNLLTVIGRDFHRQNPGRGLFVSRVESGSILITLTDMASAAHPYISEAAEITASVTGIIAFIKSIGKIILQRKHPEQDHSPDTEFDPNRSVDTMTKVVEKNGGDLRLEATDEKGRVAKAHLSIKDVTSIKKTRQQFIRAKGKSGNIDKAQVIDLADSIARQGIQDSGGVRSLIGTIVRLLIQTGNKRAVVALAEELEKRRYYEWAAAVQEAMREL
jgi:hypothetical protein